MRYAQPFSRQGIIISGSVLSTATAVFAGLYGTSHNGLPAIFLGGYSAVCLFAVISAAKKGHRS